MINASKYFVATTALEEFWDTSLPIVFLGEACKRYSRRSYWETLDSVTLPSAIQEQDVFKTIEYLDELYERILPVIAKVLNDIHGVNFSIRYWRIAIGPWLPFYLHTLHDKYIQINSVRQKYPDFTSICLDETLFLIPYETLTFAKQMNSDEYNLQLYSQLFKILGYKFPVKKSSVSLKNDVKEGFSWKPKKIANKLIQGSISLMGQGPFNKKKILFETPYFQKQSLLKLMLRMKGSLWPYVEVPRKQGDIPVNHQMRKVIENTEFGDNEFEKILLPLIGMGIPQSILEGYSQNRVNIRGKCVSPPKAIMSAIGWFFNDEFKLFAAESAEKGSILLGIQHGSGYGMSAYYFPEVYELSIVDKYYSWGWTRDDCYARVKPIAATKFAGKKIRKSHQKSRDILFVTNNFYRFTMTYPFRIDFLEDYVNQQRVFLSSVSQAVKERLVIRPHIDDGGVDLQERFRNIIPDVKIESWAQPFSKRQYALMVCDHPCVGTTFIESLINNKPSIIFANPKIAVNYPSKNAASYWNKFKEIGILYDDPALAAGKINDIYENIDEWWFQPERQDAVRSFLSEFGKVSEKWDKEWAAVLEEVLSS